MDGYVIRHTDSWRYYERNPVTGEWSFLAPFARQGDVFTAEAARVTATALRASGVPCEVVPDPHGRDARVDEPAVEPVPVGRGGR